jgi:membrane-bound lytic murein transglycosylase B
MKNMCGCDSAMRAPCAPFEVRHGAGYRAGLMLRCLRAVMFVAGLIAGNAASAASLRDNPEVERFIDELVADHQFSRGEVRRWFDRASIQAGVLKAMATPGTARPWHIYRASQITPARIRGGLEYWQRHADALARAAASFGIPEELIVATIGIETSYGRVVGNHTVFDALATLAFAYPQRAELFRGELVQYLLLTRELGVAPQHYKGSYAGALGVPQFLPGSYRRHAVDFDNDGRRDLWNHSDAIGSIASYYKAYGWQPGGKVIVELEPPSVPLSDEFRQLLERGLNPHAPVSALRGAGVSPAEAVSDDELAAVIGVESGSGPRYFLGLGNFYVITRYNRSVNYALAVHELAQELRRARQADGTK